MKIILADLKAHLRFAPLSLTRPIGDIRVGMFTNFERWTILLPEDEIGFHTESYLSDEFEQLENGVIVNACVIPNEDFVAAVVHLENNYRLVLNEITLAIHGNGDNAITFKGETPIIVNQRWDLLSVNEAAIIHDISLIKESVSFQKIPKSITVIGSKDDIYIEEGASLEACTLNTTEGPIYISNGAEIMEGSCIRGPFVMCENSVVKMGAKIYGATTIGPSCKVGGELSNVIFQGFSNKGHDGFLGNSYIGEWCNLGADTNVSNLKNNYGSVSTYCYEKEEQVNTDRQFLGLFMGDHSKTGINTMFNTGSVVGVSCNLYGAGFFPKHTLSFSWGEPNALEPFRIEKALEYANKMMDRRSEELSAEEENILVHLKDVYGLNNH
ncbi:MAG: putative sugar nucleotidyl transferase [Flavobacteriia bacterium]|nr:putative sugar nucleotidyl transferase [Flavobacteriia bacterium]